MESLLHCLLKEVNNEKKRLRQYSNALAHSSMVVEARKRLGVRREETANHDDQVNASIIPGRKKLFCSQRA